MKILTSDKKVRATELLLATRGAKATIVALRRWYNKIRSSYYDTGKTGIAIDRTANRENEINEARVIVMSFERKRQILNEDELRNIANENLANELRELTMSDIEATDSDRRA